MVMTPEQRDALPMARSLLAAADHTLGRCHANGTGEELAEAVRLLWRGYEIVADVLAGGPGPVVGVSRSQDPPEPVSPEVAKVMAAIAALMQQPAGAA